MRHLKKFASLILALVMALALAVPAMAVEQITGNGNGTQFTITVPNDGRKYEIYQIFTGDVSGTGDASVLSKVKWGANGTGTLGEAVAQTILNELNGVVESTDDATKLAVIEKYVDLTSGAVATIETTGARNVTVDPGYYLIRDMGPAGEGSSVSEYVVRIVGSFEVTPKTDTTTFVKKVQDTNDSDVTDVTSGNWQDSADHDVGDIIPFQLTATLPANYASYTLGYELVFHDSESAGLTFQAITSVQVKDRDGNVVKTLEPGDYELNTNPSHVDGEWKCTFEITIENLKTVAPEAAAGYTVVVEYTSRLNESAVMRSTGNPNEAYLEYSNNPNSNGTGKTPKDKVTVFTFKLVANKIDEEKAPLEGAGFTLYKWDDDAEVRNEDGTTEKGAWVAVGSEITGTTNFTWERIDAGKYKLVETTTPVGYNTADDLVFYVEAVHELESDDPELTELVIKNEKGEVISGEDLTFTATTETGTASTDVINYSGVRLPSTGGIGTTIFYVVGGLLAAGAVILLITKRRMSIEK